mgnify:CR=1 FL=1|jgi:hypothetical protein|tara:strand:- start:3828 stop:4070 length:243 start_codon:yes stop_codon:yes gene_type:complete
MSWIQICRAAGLGWAEIGMVEKCMEDDDGRFLESRAYEKLFDYFCDEGEMPLGVAKVRTGEPDIWILDRLASCIADSAVV